MCLKSVIQQCPLLRLSRGIDNDEWGLLFKVQERTKHYGDSNTKILLRKPVGFFHVIPG